MKRHVRIDRGHRVVGHHAVVGSSVWLTQSIDPFTVVTLEKPSLRIKTPEEVRSDLLFYQI